MWKYINSNELYHARPKGYKRGPDGTPLGYISKDSRYNDKERGIVGKNSGNINTFKPESTNYKVNTSGYKVNISDKKEKPPYEVVPINKKEVVPINKNEIISIGKNKAESEIEKFNPTLDDIFDSTNENTTKKGKEKVDDMFKNEKVDFDFTTKKGKKKVNDLLNKIRKENAEKERLAKEKEAKEKAEKEKTAKEKEAYESEAKKRDLGLEMQSIKNKQEQQKLDAATSDEKRKAKDFEDRKAREAYLDELNRYSNASNNFGTAGSRLGSAGDTVSKIRVQEKEKLDLSQFSSEELKRRIERNRLEQEYNDRFAPETRVSKGKRLVTNILYGSSALSNFAGSIASIMGAIKSFKTLSDYKK